MDPLTPNRFIARGDDGYMWNVFQPYYAQKNLELEQEISGAAALEINRPHLQLRKSSVSTTDGQQHQPSQ